MWPSVQYEEAPWVRDPEELAFVPKSRRRRISITYKAALPACIARERLALPEDISLRLMEVGEILARFDQAQAARGYDLPALMLRSESSSSSQIENLTSSVRNVALAEVSDKAPSNARIISGNVAAMREALGQEGEINIDSILSVHAALMRGFNGAGELRREQVWIGGTAYSPHGATFVPPQASRLEECLEDLMVFACRDDLPSIAKAAVFHAQFETIHPFVDGNGRTGRALLHRMLARDGVLLHSSLPVSAGLLHDVRAYMYALDAYHEGDPVPIIECLLDALEIAVLIATRMAESIDGVISGWTAANDDRAGSASHRLPALLVAQPVVDVKHVADGLEITDRAARQLVNTACERGILRKIGSTKRGSFYQAAELIEIVEQAASAKEIRRERFDMCR